ncbi:hypothetical protein LEN26_001121 [Aphanomyces euteiches]|nr:hypothetical protein AeMF1_001261 [Aphanomyces euteiches]KAH9162032.1 hypothetical protein LEN26_001121 [Aphanomyces euteiches]KAH9189574.1 hypothetical protein AeNC1_008447 [Aphanomyces euteiches]
MPPARRPNVSKKGPEKSSTPMKPTTGEQDKPSKKNGDLKVRNAKSNYDQPSESATTTKRARKSPQTMKTSLIKTRKRHRRDEERERRRQEELEREAPRDYIVLDSDDESNDDNEASGTSSSAATSSSSHEKAVESATTNGTKRKALNKKSPSRTNAVNQKPHSSLQSPTSQQSSSESASTPTSGKTALLRKRQRRETTTASRRQVDSANGAIRDNFEFDSADDQPQKVPKRLNRQPKNDKIKSTQETSEDTPAKKTIQGSGKNLGKSSLSPPVEIQQGKSRKRLLEKSRRSPRAQTKKTLKPQEKAPQRTRKTTRQRDGKQGEENSVIVLDSDNEEDENHEEEENIGGLSNSKPSVLPRLRFLVESEAIEEQ